MTLIEADLKTLSELIKNEEIKHFGLIIFQRQYNEELILQLNKLMNIDDKWLYIILNSVDDPHHVELICSSFSMLNIVAFQHSNNEEINCSLEIMSLSDLNSSDVISWLVDEADLKACMGMLWSTAMWLNNRSLHILGSKVLIGYGHLLDQALIAAKDLITIGRVGDLHIEPNTSKSIELEQLYMSRHTHSWTNIFGHSANDRIYESFYTMHPETTGVADGVKRYLESSMLDVKKYPVIMSRRRQLLSLASGQRSSWDTDNFIYASVCSAGYAGTILTPAIISNEGLTTSVIKVNFSNDCNTAVIPVSINPSGLCTRISVENILNDLREWWLKIEKIASMTNMETTFYSLLARCIGLQGSELQLAGVVISGSVQWNRTQLRYARIVRDLVFAMSYFDKSWNLLWDGSGKMVLHNSDINDRLFTAICAGQGIFGGYVYNDHVKGVALLALSGGEIETITIK